MKTKLVLSSTLVLLFLATLLINPAFAAPPKANDDFYSTDEDTTLNIAAPGVLGNDTDDDVDPLTASLQTDPSNGSLTLNIDGSFIYTPDAGFFGTDSFTYKANDGSIQSNTATVFITVNEVNTPPVAVGDSYSTNEDTTLNIAAPGVLGNDNDPDGASLDGHPAERTH